MYGAILGDIIGSPYEFDRGSKTKDFPLFTWRSEFTDDTVMTVAVAEAFLDAQPDADEDWIRRRLVASMRRWGNRYPYAGYGAKFVRWLTVRANYFVISNWFGTVMKYSELIAVEK